MLWIDVMEEAALPEGGMAAVIHWGSMSSRPRQRMFLRGLRPVRAHGLSAGRRSLDRPHLTCLVTTGVLTSERTIPRCARDQA